MWNPSEEYKQRVNKWVSDAVTDGWERTATYGDSESIDRASKLKRDGFVVQVLTREPSERTNKAEYELCGWGPDSLAIRLPHPYSWEKLQESLTVCGECGKKSTGTQRVGFAGRCCDECLPAARKKHEYPGWTN